MGDFFSHTISIVFDIIVASTLILIAQARRLDSFFKWFYPVFCITIFTSSYIRGTTFWWEANFFVTALYMVFILGIFFLNTKQPVTIRMAYSFLIPFLASHLWELPNHFLWQNWNMLYIHDFMLLGYEIGICIFITYILKALNTKVNYKIFILITLLVIPLCYIGGNPSYYTNTLLHQVCSNVSRIGCILLLCWGIRPKHL
jgi:hypothetical protein